MFTKLDRVGIIVKNLDEAISLYSDTLRLNLRDIDGVTLGDLGVKVASFPIGDSFIELLEPIGTENRFARHLREKGDGLFYFSILTEDFDTEVKTLREKGYEVVEQLQPKCSLALHLG